MKIKLLCTSFIILLTTFLQPVVAQSIRIDTVINYGSSWKYLDNGVDQTTTWRGTAFNDASWLSGAGYLGYGDTWINTCIKAGASCPAPSGPGCMPGSGCTKYITYYFRKTLNLPNPSLYDSIRLNVKRDDGIVVYVNGTEVWRDNMAGTGTYALGAVPYSALASASIDVPAETTAVSKMIPISAFSTGDNTIAVEVHQQGTGSSDLTFDMQIEALYAPLVAFGSSWKYLSSAADQGTAWSATTFNDGSWSSGTGFMGYGDPWINTCIPAGPTCPAPSGPGCVPGGCNKYPTSYFRKNMTLADLTSFDFIKFSVCRDDGIVVYVNGVEAYREHMPGGVIGYNTLANSPQIDAPAESTAVIQFVPISAFTQGTNTIAIEVHQQALTSSDLTFNVRMDGIPHAVPTVAQGPYLQMGNKTAVTVKWRTNIPSKSRVLAGTTLGTYPIVVSDAAVVTEHEVRLTGLNPDTKYFYQVASDVDIIQGDLNNFFTTAPADNSTRRVTMAVFGDCGRNDNSFQTGSLTSYQNYLTSQNMKAADLMLLVGDNAYDAGTDGEFTANFFNRYSGNILKNHMLFPAPGNHDYANDGNRQIDHNVPYYSLFNLPTAGECGGVPSGTEAYYSYDWGNVHVLSLDSYGKENAGTTRLYDTNGAQVNWIKSDLAANNKKWTIVYFHHAPFTKGSHNSDAGGGDQELADIRNNFIRILERYGVDMVICGHSHDYERSYLLKGYYGTEASFNINAHTADASSAKYNGTTNSCPYMIPSGHVNHGTVYVVSGSAGADGGTSGGWPHDALPFSIDDGGMFYLDINDNRLNAKFLRRDNSIGDSFTILKDVKVQDTVKIFPGQSVNLNATWPGTYAWNTGVTTRGTSVTPDTDTMMTVKDKLTGTCITDKHYIDVTCTTPVFTSSPSNVVVSPCDAVVNYSATDTATPTPVLSYTFSGATTGSGSGTGSGSLFNPGKTVVTLAATNTCGATLSTFTVTVNPYPTTVNVSGGGTYCDHTTINASNGNDGTIYYQGTTSGGTSTVTPATSQLIISSGTYYFRALGADGCWGAEGSAAVVINSLPTVTFTIEPNAIVCANQNVSYATQTSMSNYTWTYPGSVLNTDYTITNGGGNGSNEVTLKWLTQGQKTVTVNYNDNNSCSSEVPPSSEVTTTLPPAAIAGNAPLCTGGSTITLTNVAANGTWSGGTTGIATVNTVTGSVTSGATSGIAIISYANGCGTPATITATVNATPAAITGIAPLCANGSSLTLANSTANGTWTSNSPSIASVNSITGVVTSGTVPGNATISYSNNCGIAATITATVNPLPAIHTFTGGGSYCTGDAGVPVGLTLTESGISYQLYRETTATGSPMSGTGAATGFGIQSIPGVYHVIATNTATACTNYLSGVTIGIVPLPDTFNVTGGGSYCNGNTGIPVGIDGSQTGINYQLYNGSSLDGSAIPGTGSALTFGVKDSGHYTVVATTTAIHCSSNMSGDAIVTEHPLPNNYNITGGGAYCSGDTGVHVRISGSDTGVAYRLYRGGSAIGTDVAGSGAILDLGLQTIAGVYKVKATNTHTGCIKAIGDSVTISINGLPGQHNVTGGGSHCMGSGGVHVGLNNSTPGIKYMLTRNNVATGINIKGTNSPIDFGAQVIAGTYKTVATDTVTGCKRTMNDSAKVVVDLVVTPDVNITTNSVAGNTVCYNQPITFTALTGNGGIAPSYLWRVNGTNVGVAGSIYTYTPTDNDIVSVQLTSSAPCATPSQAINNITVNVDTPEAPSVFIQARNFITAAETDTLTAITQHCGAAPQYQWYLNGATIHGATNAVYISKFANNDSVSCMVEANVLCGDLITSNSIVIRIFGLGINSTVSGTKVAIIPNPNKGVFTLAGKWNASYDEAVFAEITDVLGHVVYKNTLMTQNGSVNEKIQLNTSISSGMYLLNLRSADRHEVLHFVVEQ